MSKKMKNIAQSEVLTLREQISYQEGQIVSKTLTKESDFMKATKVDKDLCIGCGLCCGICGEVFRMNEQEKAEAYQRANAENQGAVQEAADSCPVSAIA